MNPDLIFKMDACGCIEYMNPSVKCHLDRLGLSEDDANTLLPGDYIKHVKAVAGKDKTIQVSHIVEGANIEFTFRGAFEQSMIFVSGHDSTRLHKLQSHLRDSQRQMDQMTDFLGEALSDYGQNEFDIHCLHEGIIGTLILSDREHDSLVATHVFLAEFIDEKLKGYVYRGTDTGIIRDPDEIIIDPSKKKYAILQGIGQLTWSNWEDEGGTLESFQDRFHPFVRDKIGTIERFATFNSGRIALIAFYKGRKLTDFDAKVLKGLAVYANGLHRIAHEQKQTEQAFEYTVNSLARASEANDEDTGDHIIRLNEYSRALATQMKLPDDFIRTIHYSAQMHDVGKIHVNPEILKKPGRLTQEEFHEMQSHPGYGAKILGDSPRLAMAAEIALGHHEKYNGNGYPFGLSGEEIPLSARIVALADVYDALRQKRVYKPAFSHEKTMDIICNGDGRTNPNEFDPKVMKAFKEIEIEMAQIFDSYQN
ncbi:MAG: HD domain-containing protein [Magnetovibrio sp.]|nr:HD domain-containing protein [Magnetovibrio sp.]